MNLFCSSIGRKILMAVTGVVLIGFAAGHLVGNLQVFAHPDRINGYAHFLQSLGPVLWLVRLVLLACVVIHIWAATVLSMENTTARGAPYGVKHTIQATLASRLMRWTGTSCWRLSSITSRTSRSGSPNPARSRQTWTPT